jgi:hypothetical protein
LVLESNPVQAFRNFLFVVLVGGQIIGTLSGDFVSQFSGNDASMNFLFYNKKETILRD